MSTKEDEQGKKITGNTVASQKVNYSKYCCFENPCTGRYTRI